VSFKHALDFNDNQLTDYGIASAELDKTHMLDRYKYDGEFRTITDVLVATLKRQQLCTSDVARALKLADMIVWEEVQGVEDTK
jgi:hypothetical protein